MSSFARSPVRMVDVVPGLISYQDRNLISAQHSSGNTVWISDQRSLKTPLAAGELSGRDRGTFGEKRLHWPPLIVC
jgi:hypothetical protein